MDYFALRAVRRSSARGLTRRKISELEQLARLSGRARQKYVDEYWSQRFATQILTSLRRVAAGRSGNWPQNGLTGHQNRLALESALVLLKSGWARAMSETRAWVISDERWTGNDRAWLLYVLDHRNELQTCLNGDAPNVLPELVGGAGRQRLAKALRRRLLNDRGSKPKLRANNWFTLDTNSYRVFERPEDRHFKGAWIAISGLEKRRRVCVPLAGTSLLEFQPRSSMKNSRPGLLVIVKDRVTVVVTKRVPIPVLSATSLELGIDKGYRALLTASSGDAAAAKTYGQQSSELIGRIAELDSQRVKNRRRLRSFERSVRAANRAKARHIRRRNLGSRKQERISRRHKAQLRQQIGEAVNGLFLDHPQLSVLHVESLNFVGRPLSATINRRLARWLKGRLQSSLFHKAQLHGVRLNVVNAAFTSLTCPQCWYPSRANRHGERFLCRSCGYSGSADAVAATNVLKRGRDRAIMRFTRRERVRQILEMRWRSALSGGAWDSSGVADGATPEPRITANAQSTDDVACLTNCESSPLFTLETAEPTGG